ncbi:MAG TPA: dTMP kinase [Candidatus Marinimicrobia bacterium]|jgi:dTMP kinase|nr:dTMP kinase [Candidatus Neomarinimicrobiota bacterium]MDP6260497.1 dTMP kinase [Candidatus Neomarinimicrobiota bacterium]MDP7127174.1 dTMP kinase [Candidatus Neomarinimicrobiota bacterium]MDP7336694.1 dTMP kinase [Candidatus Neomarinimicrobiota bacterium]MDP7474708.1 dTMP kinase [Candidatus Neomarinimicrobiota bacterium]|tara:strand:+ start:7081 stop:7716 length:636 start_codon:yes stop_codon:yes gene_type:complete
MSTSDKARFISFEGIDGSGKSTQAKLFLDRLIQEDREGILVREPGGTPISEAIRHVLLTKGNRQMVARTEALLMTASRSQLTKEVILPNLGQNRWVIADRYADSTLAYQGGGRELNLDWLQDLNKFATYDLEPNVTFVIDILPKEALRRREQTEDRIEEEGIAFQKRVRRTYLDLAQQYSDRIIVIDGHKSREIIQNNIWDEIKRRYFLTQ